VSVLVTVSESVRELGCVLVSECVLGPRISCRDPRTGSRRPSTGLGLAHGNERAHGLGHGDEHGHGPLTA